MSMLPKEFRLKHMKDFDILFKEGHFVSGNLVVIKVWKVEPEKYTRHEYSEKNLKIGFVVGKKVSKSAVKRNRVKRQMREVVRLLLKKNMLKLGFHVSIMAKPLILGKKYDEIEQDLFNALKKAGLLKL
ncbi:MAG: ribonuclease P protein component [Candidatus Magasanikbacteria bacterium]